MFERWVDNHETRLCVLIGSGQYLYQCLENQRTCFWLCLNLETFFSVSIYLKLNINWQISTFKIWGFFLYFLRVQCTFTNMCMLCMSLPINSLRHMSVLECWYKGDRPLPVNYFQNNSSFGNCSFNTLIAMLGTYNQH